MIHLVTGGARSGKSTWAEEQIRQIPHGTRIYIATMDPGDDPDNHRRIAKHRSQRADKGFQTIECPVGLDAVVLPEDSVVLLECLTNLVANEMFDETGTVSDPTERVLEGISALRGQCYALIVVTNEVGCGGQTYDEGTEAYIHVIGHVNAMLASAADVVVEVVCGIPISLKGELPSRVEMPAPSGEA